MSATTAAAPITGEEATTPGNIVQMTSAAVLSIDYLEGSLTVPPNRPMPEPPKVSRSGTTWSINLIADRVASPAVADGFLNICGGADYVFCSTVISDNVPGILHFYFGLKVRLQIGGKIYDETLYVGQGYRALVNNWWIGGPCLVNHSGPILVVIGPRLNDVKEVYSVSGDANSFTLAPWF